MSFQAGGFAGLRIDLLTEAPIVITVGESIELEVLATEGGVTFDPLNTDIVSVVVRKNIIEDRPDAPIDPVTGIVTATSVGTTSLRITSDVNSTIFFDVPIYVIEFISPPSPRLLSSPPIPTIPPIEGFEIKITAPSFGSVVRYDPTGETPTGNRLLEPGTQVRFFVNAGNRFSFSVEALTGFDVSRGWQGGETIPGFVTGPTPTDTGFRTPISAIVTPRSDLDLVPLVSSTERPPPSLPKPVNPVVSITPSQQSVLGGQSIQFFGSASVGEVTYQSLNTNIATINQQGIATGISTGSTTIRAISNINSDFFADASLQVDILDKTIPPITEPLIPVVSITPLQQSVIEGQSIQFFGSANVGGVRYESSNPNIATINQQGVTTGISTGTTTISAISTIDPGYFANAILRVDARPRWRNCINGNLIDGSPPAEYVSRRFRGPGGGLCFEPASFIGFRPSLENIIFRYQRASSQFPASFVFDVDNPSFAVSYRITFEINNRFFEVSPRQFTIAPDSSRRINISANRQNINEFQDGITPIDFKVRVEEI
jgi:hypothetical protein